MTLVLTQGTLPSLLPHTHPNLGRLVQSRHYARLPDTGRARRLWAADNDIHVGDLDVDARQRMRDACVGIPGLLWVTFPDVVGDAPYGPSPGVHAGLVSSSSKRMPVCPRASSKWTFCVPSTSTRTSRGWVPIRVPQAVRRPASSPIPDALCTDRPPSRQWLDVSRATLDRALGPSAAQDTGS